MGKKEKDIFECNGKEVKGTGVRKMGSKEKHGAAGTSRIDSLANLALWAENCELLLLLA